MEHDDQGPNALISRRDVLRIAGLGAMASGLGVSGAGSRVASAAQSASGRARGRGPYNILFILTDQERFFRPGELPAGYRLPAHERLRKQGTTFVNHRIGSCVCTPSRSVVYTGQHIQHTRMFDNTNFPWIQSMSTEIPTLGHMLREAGYYTAYKGKWHLTREFETVNEHGNLTKIFTQEMEAYGFSRLFQCRRYYRPHRRLSHDGIISAMAGIGFAARARVGGGR
jgi:arylsulfatase